jgi:hypothetical protein
MKLFKILPAAAGVIALTASVAFARDDRECEEDGFCRTIIAVRSSINDTDSAANRLQTVPDQPAEDVYYVKVVRGNKTKLVSVDAYTGLVIGNRDIS